jgi:hypothetical protein
VLHTWTSAYFLADPFTWTLLAIGCALARAQLGVGRTGTVEQELGARPAGTPASSF